MTNFVLKKYQTNLLLAPGLTEPLIGFIRVSPLTLEFESNGSANDPAEGDVNTIIPIRASRNRKYGISARVLTIARQAASGDTSKTIYRRVPILNPILFDQICSTLAPDISYEDETDWRVVEGAHERYHLFTDSQ